jgi:energy-coupling factor transporter ATP-binding protein EcfA2
MKRITEIEFKNYKAFYESGFENKIEIPKGRNVLLYGENGSGKSSIYEGLKQFFSSSDNTVETIPSRHLKIPKTRIENEGEPNEAEITNEVSVKVKFTDGDNDEIKIFGVPVSDTQGVNYIAEANLLNTFLSYRELLRTYLMDNPKDKEEFRRKFAELLIETILSKQRNSVTQQTFQKSWGDLFVARAWYKEENLEKFTNGLKYEINRLNLILPSLLGHFEKDFKVQLVLEKSKIEYHYSTKQKRSGKYPICEIDLKVQLFGEDAENDEENHLTVLNEARLSALAISIYFASLINTPQNNFNFKILFLDDIFIGLDMSNRLPLLDILKDYKKPVIEQYLDTENNNAVAERIQLLADIPQTEPLPFFRDYQIFITTYDNYWFSVAKNWAQTKAPDNWHYIEMFANQREGLTFNTPLILSSLSYFQKAKYYFKKHEYPSCANHLRKALEKRIKELLPANQHYNEYFDNETGVTEIKKLKTLNQYLEKFIQYCEINGINAAELADLKNLKDWYFNPFSHDNIGTPIFKRELELAIALIDKLDTFEFKILLPASTNLYFRFDNQAGETREYKIELLENLRWIRSYRGNILVDVNIGCYEWTTNGNVNLVDWGLNGNPPQSLFLFYNNKLNRLLNRNVDTRVEMPILWNELMQESNGEPIANLLVAANQPII